MRFRDALISAWRTGSLVICVVIPLACLANDAPKQALSSRIRSLQLESPGQFLVRHVLNPVGQQLQSIGVGNLNLPRRSQLLRSYSPPRQVHLLNGERVTAEVLRADGEYIELRLRSGQRTIVRRDAIASISVPVGEQQLLYESFEQSSQPALAEFPVLQRPPLDPASIDQQHAASGRSSLKLTVAAQPMLYVLPDLSAATRVQFWFRVETQPVPPADKLNEVDLEPLASAFNVDFHFNTGDAKAHWELRTTGNRIAVSNDGHDELTVRQTVLLNQGWHCLTAAIGPDRATISVDESLLVSTGHTPGRLQSIQFASDRVAWVDDLQIYQQVEESEGMVRRVTSDADCVIMRSGDQLYGRIKQIEPENIVLSRAGDNLDIPWSLVNNIALRQAEHAVAGAKSDRDSDAASDPQALPDRPNQWATVEFQSSFNFPRQQSDRLQVAITSIQRDFLIAWHPFLGEMAISWNQVARVESHFFGRSLMLDARVLHLGDSIREDFRRATPDGTQWSTEFDLPAPLPPELDLWLSMDVVDLEPAGPGTPPASPFLKELRSGRLLTQIKVNQESAGDLNRWIHFRSSPGHPERVRCRLPASALKVGRNQISLNQLPRKESRAGFDNCELSNLRLEVIQR